MPLWPSYLPFCPVDGSLAIEPVTSLIEGPSEINGLGSRRPRYSGRFHSYSFDMVLTRAQRDQLLGFFFADCAQGAVSFQAQDPANATDQQTFTWVSPPSFRAHTANGQAWRVNLSLLKRG
jgi:hypothetical protein